MNSSRQHQISSNNANNKIKKVILWECFCYRLSFATRNEAIIKNYKKACDGGVAKGCSNLGVLNGEGIKQDFKKAKEYFGKACDLQEQAGCDNYRKLNEKQLLWSFLILLS